jgi:hypothetical protein
MQTLFYRQKILDKIIKRSLLKLFINPKMLSKPTNIAIFISSSLFYLCFFKNVYVAFILTENGTEFKKK